MTCVHLQQLYRLCQEHDLKLGGSDLIHIVCNQCGEQEVCPSMMTDEYDAKHPQPATAERSDDEANAANS
jgi:hypothetical protein